MTKATEATIRQTKDHLRKKIKTKTDHPSIGPDLASDPDRLRRNCTAPENLNTIDDRSSNSFLPLNVATMECHVGGSAVPVPLFPVVEIVATLGPKRSTSTEGFLVVLRRTLFFPSLSQRPQSLPSTLQ